MSHSHSHTRPKTPQELRTAALETVLIEKGLVSTDAIDTIVNAFQNEIGPRNGARMVARAWVDPAYRERLLTDAVAAAAEFGIRRDGGRADPVRREHARGPQRHRVHALLVLPVADPGHPSRLVQEPALPVARGARAARCP